MTVGSGAGDADRSAEEQATQQAPKVFVDLHCHTRASFDSLADPGSVVRAAAQRGLTHLAITDHDRIDAALAVRDAAPEGLTIIVGEEIKSADGDLIALFLRQAVPPGLSALETIAAVREQHGLIGVPHPYDRRAFGKGNPNLLDEIADRIDWVEACNARVFRGTANEKAALFAREHGLPGIAASDSHTVLEVGVAYNVMHGDPSTPEGLLAALKDVDLIPGRATYYVRAWTPIAKTIQSLRGQGKVHPQPKSESSR